MNAIWKPTLKQQQKKQRNRRLLLFSFLFFLAGIGYFLLPTHPSRKPESPPTTLSEQTKEINPPSTEIAPQPEPIFTRAITAGDTLSSIMDSLKIPQNTMYQILAADESLLALDVLRLGNQLTFTLDKETRQLMTMELFIHRGKQIIYQRSDADNFRYQEIILPGIWEEQLLSGEIHGSFFQSALAIGLSEQEVANIADLFKSRLNFSREIRAGDRFQVVRTQQFVDGEPTGQSQILGVQILCHRSRHDAFLFEDGHYYDHNGDSLARAFLRYPHKGHFRISSSFNPARRHPVTGRIAPHRGVDFAMPTGTRILATGDGIVTRVKSHPFAGKYIEIQHGVQYTTRYLHLSRISVKRGQRIKRGELIALSGNTGRSTGPHLHYELHIKNRAVDPTTAKIPMAASIPQGKRQMFKKQVAELIAVMNPPQHHQVSRHTQETKQDNPENLVEKPTI